MFKELTGDSVVLVQAGVYKHTSLHSYDDGLYAKAAGGYVRIRSDGTTSRDGIRVVAVETDTQLWADKFGRICVKPAKGRKPVCLSGTSDQPLFLPKD